MTPFHQFVFFLSTAQEQLDRFFGTEKSTHPATSYIGPDLIAPGTYLAQDGALVRDESIETGEGAAIDAAGV